MTARIDRDVSRRYLLTRRLSSEFNEVCWVMCNPSTADDEFDDATIRSVKRLSEAAGFGQLSVVNLYSYRATNPRHLRDAAEAGIDIVGPDNDDSILDAARSADVVVEAWGAVGGTMGERRIAAVREVLDLAGTAVVALGYTKAGHPGHPLYAPTGRLRDRLAVR